MRGRNHRIGSVIVLRACQTSLINICPPPRKYITRFAPPHFSSQTNNYLLPSVVFFFLERDVGKSRVLEDDFQSAAQKSDVMSYRVSLPLSL